MAQKVRFPAQVSLGPEWTLIEKNYYTMTYLMGGSMRPGAEGKVAPGLWGPWTITDFSGWSDQMTLDYNFECVVCHRQSLSIRRLDHHTP